ncbi:DUF2946 domain-containing protein [Paraburkholderia sp. J63]|uniref:DUF2946 domain-containing protein n=1 Tax=Paraburkholderia sp. J63 TaxID=2805434 RepID=UPI002ABE29A1|nr:DUF2946 domain-containing protein [Paraburkholderia sp. J63]
MRRFHLKLVSLLGTLAILMTTLAPVISHLLAASTAQATQALGAQAAAPMMSGHCDMPSMRGAMAATQATHGHSANAHGSPGDMQDCGYCNLFAHLPAAPGVPVPLLLATRLEHARVVARFARLTRAEPLTFALARAPPSA